VELSRCQPTAATRAPKHATNHPLLSVSIRSFGYVADSALHGMMILLTIKIILIIIMIIVMMMMQVS